MKGNMVTEKDLEKQEQFLRTEGIKIIEEYKLKPMAAGDKILITGGNGLLGSCIKDLLPESLCPSREKLDILNEGINEYFLKEKPGVVIHCAALTPPAESDRKPIESIFTNIVGTCNVIKACSLVGAKFVYISTDYVFSGSKGMYKEGDELRPVNKYAWSKLGGECAARIYDNHLIIRTSFGPKDFPYKSAFDDQYTSRETVDVVAKKIVSILDKSGEYHVGGSRRTVYEYARELKNVSRSSRKSISGYTIPKDTSLDTSKFDSEFK